MLYTISKCFNIRSKALLLAFSIMLIGAGCASTKSGSPAASGSANKSGERIITGISTSDEAGAVKIKILGNSPLRYTSVKQASPLGIVLYFPGTRLEGVQQDYPAQGDFLGSVKTSQQDHASGSDSRVKILLNKDVDYDVIREENSLVISLAKSDASLAIDNPVAAETDKIASNDESSVVEQPAASSDNELLEEVPVQTGLDTVNAGGDAVVEEKAVEKTAVDSADTVIVENEKSEQAGSPGEAGFSVADESHSNVALAEPKATNEEKVVAATKENVPEPIEPVESKINATDEKVSDVGKAEVASEPVVVDDAKEVADKYQSEAVDTSAAESDKVATPVSAMRTEKNATKIIGISKKVEGDHVVVDIKADGKIDDYKIFTIPADKKNSARIVCDIYKLNGIKAKGEQKLTVNSKGVTKVRYNSSPDKTRVVVDTNNDNLKTYNANSHSQGIEIQIGSKLLADSGTMDREPHGSVMASEVVGTKETAAKASQDDIATDGSTKGSEKAAEPLGQKTVAAVDENDMAAKETVEPPPVEKAEVTDALPAADSETVVKPTVNEKNWVKRVDFTSEKNGKSSFIIETAHTVKYTTSKKNKKTIHFRLFDTKLPKSRKFPFITTRFESAVNRIIPVQTKRMKDNALFIIELREAVPFSIDQQGEVIKINFAKSKVRPRPESKAGLAPWKEVLSRTSEIRDIEMQASGADNSVTSSGGITSDGKVIELRAGSMSEPVRDLDSGKEINARGAGAARPSMDSKSSGSLYSASDADFDTRASDPGYSSFVPKKRYTGEKISVDFFDTDIKNVFRIIRAVSGQNFAIDKDVTGKVTMTLDKPVPWDQVLDLVLKMNMLGMTTEGGINRIATLETLKQEEEKRLEYIAAEEKTKMKKVALEPMFTEYILINYSNAEKEILPHLEKLLTKDRGKASVDVRTNQIILTDTKDIIKQAKGLIRKLDRITPQVIIEARIVEATTTFSRNLGMQWGMNSSPNYDIYSDALGGTYGYSVAMNNTVASKSSIGINFTKLTNAQFLLNAKLMAMESKGEGKIISAPKVLTMDNKEATIVQGVEVPFSTVSSEGTQTTFKKIELKLTVTPHVTADNKIVLKVLIDKNDVGGITDLGPTITTKKVESELLISDGDTIVIGGIIKSNKSLTDEGFPVLQHIPVIGWLFKSRITSEDKQELLIFISPRIVSYEETSER